MLRRHPMPARVLQPPFPSPSGRGRGAARISPGVAHHERLASTRSSRAGAGRPLGACLVPGPRLRPTRRPPSGGRGPRGTRRPLAVASLRPRPPSSPARRGLLADHRRARTSSRAIRVGLRSGALRLASRRVWPTSSRGRRACPLRAPLGPRALDLPQAPSPGLPLTSLPSGGTTQGWKAAICTSFATP